MRSNNAYALMGLLSMKPMSGYELKSWVDKALSHFWKTSFGQIYPTLNTFIKDGVATVETKERQGKMRKIYTLTETGKNELIEWLKIDVEDYNVRDERLLKFYFSDLLPIEYVIEQAEYAMDYNQDLVEKYSHDIERMEEVKKPTRQELNQYLATKRGVYFNEARVKWAEECVRALKWYQSLEE